MGGGASVEDSAADEDVGYSARHVPCRRAGAAERSRGPLGRDTFRAGGWPLMAERIFARPLQRGRERFICMFFPPLATPAASPVIYKAPNSVIHERIRKKLK